MSKKTFTEFADINLSGDRIDYAIQEEKYGLLDIPEKMTDYDWEKWADKNLGTAFNQRNNYIVGYEGVTGTGHLRHFNDKDKAKKFCKETINMNLGCKIIEPDEPIPIEFMDDEFDDL